MTKTIKELLVPNKSVSKLNKPSIEQFCRQWRIKELSLFGSVLRDDFRSDSDIDFLVTFAEDAHWSLLDIIQMENELTQIVGRPVDLVSKRAIEESPNWLRKERILNSARPYISFAESGVNHELA